MTTNGIPRNHSFVYGEQEFPFNLEIFNCFSRYFISTGNSNPDAKINIFDENNEIFPADYFQYFIQYCQNQPITINHQNVIPLHKLSKKFLVPTLISQTEKYITDHQSDFVLYFFQLFKDQIQQLKEEINQQNKQIELLKKPRICIPFLGENCKLNGILSYLQKSVTLSAGGKHDPSHPLENILIDDTSYFYNYFGDFHICKSEEDSWILFDFGPQFRVILRSYLIRSNVAKPCYSHHPKSWKILGSIDNNEWKLLDRRLNDEKLNGEYKQSNFICQETENINFNNRYRYIKFVQDNNWSDGHGEPAVPFDVYISFFELYGDIFYIESK